MSNVAPSSHCVCLSSGHCHACLAAGRRCALPGCRCTCADGRACSVRRAPAMPLPVLEGGGSDETIAPMMTPTTSEGLIEALTASVAVTAPRASWSQRPAAVHAAARPLTTEDLDAHERRRLARIAPSLAKRVVAHSRARGVA